ncbi:MAG TPA: hypothetical protein DEW35_01980, partial [Ruminococcaceae bacterium]|nr:hypothetical protein [Oscillospiraceae bacterium]
QVSSLAPINPNQPFGLIWIFLFILWRDLKRAVLPLGKIATFRWTVAKPACVPTPVGVWASLVTRTKKSESDR